MKLEDCWSRQISITKLAKKMGYHRGHVQCVLAGRHNPGPKFLAALEKVDIESVKKNSNKNQLNDS